VNFALRGTWRGCRCRRAASLLAIRAFEKTSQVRERATGTEEAGSWSPAYYFWHSASASLVLYYGHMRTESWLRAAGIGTWIICGLPTAIRIGTGNLGSPSALVVWAIAFSAFGLAFWLNTDPALRCRPSSFRAPFLVVQTVAASVLLVLTRQNVPAAMFVIVAGQLPSMMPMPVVVSWITVQTLITAVVMWTEDGPVGAIVGGGAYAGFQVFAAATSWLATSERASREKLAEANAELVATRELLAESSRVSERLRIARDLHDTLGHHLTALSLNLDVASRLSNGAAAPKVREAHAITKLLLSDVRDVVSRIRDSGRVNLTSALRSLAESTSQPAVHLELPDPLEVPDPAHAEVLFRCVQEVITNAARHAGASNLWITLRCRDDGIEIHARDDGQGVGEVTFGHGLRGMQERLQEFAGHVRIESSPGHGFEIHGWLPSIEGV
jgi:signal transduction histidine kinase